MWNQHWYMNLEVCDTHKPRIWTPIFGRHCFKPVIWWDLINVQSTLIYEFISLWCKSKPHKIAAFIFGRHCPNGVLWCVYQCEISIFIWIQRFVMHIKTSKNCTTLDLVGITPIPYFGVIQSMWNQHWCSLWCTNLLQLQSWQALRHCCSLVWLNQHGCME